jgi:hypothetical protein
MTTLHDLANIPHLTISITLVDRRTKHYSQANHLMRPHQNFCSYTNTRIDARGVTTELKIRLKFYPS